MPAFSLDALVQRVPRLAAMWQVSDLRISVIALGMSLWKEPDFDLLCVIYSGVASMFSALRWTYTQSVTQDGHTGVDVLILLTAPSAV